MTNELKVNMVYDVLVNKHSIKEAAENHGVKMTTAFRLVSDAKKKPGFLRNKVEAESSKKENQELICSLSEGMLDLNKKIMNAKHLQMLVK